MAVLRWQNLGCLATVLLCLDSVRSQISPVTCESNEFACHDGLCIPNSYLCDTQFDCIEGEDEFDCTEPFPDCMPLGYDLVRCPGPRNAGCIFDEWFCDQENDCRDGSDEHVAQCGQPQPCDSYLFQCNNGICIQTSWVCDQDNDCGDSSDEMNCPTVACSSTTDFTCANGRCVKLDVLCDGFNDCRDYSDELPRYCPVTEPPLICGSGEILCQGVCVQPRDCQINQCELYPSVCSQNCTYDSNARDYTCSCDSGFDLQPDGYTCIAKSTIPPMLYFCNKYYIRKTGVNYSPNANGNGTIVGQDFGFVVAFDYDYADQKIYVTDVGAHKIISMNMDGTDKKEIVKGRLHSVEGIAVDWVTKKLYWTDRTYDVLEVANQDGSMRKTLVRENMFEPRGVAVDPRDGYVYWTDWGLYAYIGRIGMDGTDEKELHNDAIVWPNGITIDYPSNKIYWTDAHLDYLAYADLDFNNFHRVLSDARDHTIAHPFSVSVFEDTMYWTDWNEFKLYKANKRDGSRIEVLLSDLPLRPMDIHVVHSHKQATNLPNPCINNNGGCSHLCLMTPISTPGSTAPGFVCACPDNFVLGNDQKTCASDCLNTQFLCNSIHRCIDQLWVCDGEEDCPYGEDEKYCTEHRHCDPKFFECSVSHSCIHPNLVCDGKPDCLTDTSDEDNCQNTQCQAWEFRCSTGKCIPHTDVCDQTEDCANGDDEKPEVCQDHRCYDGYFQCSNGFCIPELWVCDLDNDCGDGSDEPFNCATRTCKDGWFACRTNYRCVPGWAVCYGGDHCRDNSDEQDCTLKTCDPRGEFQCSTGGQCVPKRWYCDAESDCPDGSDEPIICSPRQCSESEHKCDNDRCIPGAWKCDGDFDCGEGDESDEASCKSIVCETGQFKCLKPGYCIAEALRCDGKAACEDASDELNCPTRFPGGLWCPDDFFTCDTTACIPKWWVCDGENDCTDASDEKQSYCATVINQCNSEHSRWLCDDGTCILEWERCDNVPHCPDGSDEFPSLCTPDRVCDANTEFDCPNGFCIPISTVCDKRNDCGVTAWDEVGCNNGTCGSNNGGCAQDCIDTKNGYYCECRAGYITDPDRPANCIDFDDCATKPCSQVCYNLKGGYNCACVEGFREDVTRPGEGICLSDGTEFVLIGAEKEIIKYYPRDNRFQDFIKNEVLIEGIDFHYDLERVYFVDGDRGDLKEAHKDINGDEVAYNLGIDNLYSPYYVALDWVANNLYFTDHGEAGRESGRFRRAAVDLRPKVGVISNKGNNFHWREAVIVADRLERPTGLAVNPRKGLLYWTDLGSTVNPDAKVEMAWMNGKNRKEIMIDSNNVEFRDFVQPTGLSIDFNSNDTVYFCDFRADVIGYFGWDGWNVRILANKETLRAPFSNLGSINPYQLDVFASQIYFTTKNTAANNFVIVMGKNATSDPPRELFSKPANTLGGIKVYHERRYPFGVPNPCEYAKCADMCVLTPPNENNIYSGFDCICGSTGRDEVVVEGCEVDNYIPPKTMEPSSPNKPTTTQRSDCTTLGCFNSGTCQQTIGTCVCKTGFDGDLCQYQGGTNETQQGDQSDNGTCGSNNGGCAQDCIDTTNGYYCECRAGYITDPDRPANCIDFDDCATKPCSQVCYNLKGGYNCACVEGFREDVTRPGEGICLSNGTEFVLIGAEKEIIKYYPRDNRFQDFIKNEVLIEGIDFHYDLERVYFVDGDRGDLKEAHKDNNADEVANNLGIDNLYSPYYVALDWVANNLYFTDHGEAGRESGRFRRAAVDLRPKVGVISKKGNNFHWREAVIVADRLERPTGLAVNPRKGLLYWTDLGSTVNPDAKVEMAWMNGKNRKEIMIDSNNVEFRDFVQPTGLSIDFNSNDTVYFCDFRADVIGYFGWDGWNVRILANKETLRAPFSNLGSINPYQLDVFASQIYFTTKNTAANNFVIVMGKNATSDPPRELFSKPANTLGGIKVYHERRYPFGVPNPCEYAQCADMCVLTPPNENNVIYSGFDCICGSTGRDEVVVEGCEVEPSSPNKPTTTQRSDCTTLGCFNSGTCQQTIGTCVCKTGFNGDLCQYQGGTNETQQGDQSVVAYPVAAGVVFLILLLLVLAVFILVCYVKRNKRSAKPVVYRTGANVEIPGHMAAPAGEPVYESNLNPQPVTFKNPGFGTPGVQAAGGDDPEKTGLPPNFADVLPEKVDLNYPEGQPGGMDNRYSHMPGPYPMNPPEPPPAYTEEELKK